MDISTNEKEAGSVDPTSRGSSDTASDSGTSGDGGGRGGGGSKMCGDCRTTKTPLWRAGPDGPKSLCNACGIRYRKERRGEGEGVGMVEKLRKQRSSNYSSWEGFRRRRRKKSWRRVLGEEEQAALLLMALSTKPFLD